MRKLRVLLLLLLAVLCTHSGLAEEFTVYIKLGNNLGTNFDGKTPHLYMWAKENNTDVVQEAWAGIAGSKNHGINSLSEYYQFKLPKRQSTDGDYTCSYIVNNGKDQGFQTADLTGTFTHNGKYTINFAGTNNKTNATLVSDGTYSAGTTYTITATPATWWSENVDMSKLTLKVGDGTNMHALTDGKVTLANAPTMFEYTGTVEAKANSVYANNKDLINLPEMKGELTGSGTALTAALATPSLNNYTVTVNSYADAAKPVVTINGTVLADVTPNNNVYTYTFTANKEITSAIVKVGDASSNLTFDAEKKATATFTDPRKDYTITVTPADWWASNGALGKLQYKVGESGAWVDVPEGGQVKLANAPTHYQYVSFTPTANTDVAKNAANIEYTLTGALTAGTEADNVTPLTATLAAPSLTKYWFTVKAYEDCGDPTVTFTDITVPAATVSGNDYTYVILTNKKSGNQTVSVKVASQTDNAVSLTADPSAAQEVVFEKPADYVFYVKFVDKDGNIVTELNDKCYIYMFNASETQKWENLPAEATKEPGLKHESYDAVTGFHTFNFGPVASIGSGKYIFKIDTWNTKSGDNEFAVGSTFVNGKYYIYNWAGHANTGTLTETTAPVTYTITANNPEWWTSNVTLGQLQVKAADDAKWNDVPADGKLKLITAPTQFQYVSAAAKAESDYAKNQAFITLPAIVGTLTGTSSDLTVALANPNVTERTFSVTTYKGAEGATLTAPVVTVNNVAVTGVLAADGVTYNYALKSNKSDLTGTVTFDGVTKNIDFSNGNTFTDTRQDFTFYLDANYMMNHAYTQGNNCYPEAQSDWQNPVVYYTAPGAAVTTETTPVAMTPIAGGVYSVTINARGVSMIKFENTYTGNGGGGKMNHWDTRGVQVDNPVAGTVYRVKPHATHQGSVVESPCEAVGLYTDLYNSATSTYTFKLKTYKKEGATPAMYLYLTRAKNKDDQFKLDDPTVETVADGNKEYTYTFETAHKALGELTAAVQYDGTSRDFYCKTAEAKDFVLDYPTHALDRANNANTPINIDVTGAAVELTLTSGAKVSVPAETKVLNYAFEEIGTAKFTTGIQVKDVNNDKVNTAANQIAEWPAVITQGTDGKYTVTPKIITPEGYRSYTFVYHDWRKDNYAAPQSVNVQDKDKTKTLTAWLKESKQTGTTAGAARAAGTTLTDAEIAANAESGIDDYCTNLPAPAKAPGCDYTYVVATTDADFKFEGATATIIPTTGTEVLKPQTTTIAFPETVPATNAPIGYASTEYRIYRVGSAVQWKLSQATEYVSTSGVFYIDHLLKSGSYKFSTHDPRKDWTKNDQGEEVGNWTEFNNHILGVNTDDKADFAVESDKEYTFLSQEATTQAKSNIKPTDDGTLVIDLRGGTPSAPGTMVMHKGFYRLGGKITFYGNAEFDVNKKDIKLSGVGLYNNDAMQFIGSKDGSKKYLKDQVTGYKVTVTEGTETATPLYTKDVKATVAGDHHEFEALTLKDVIPNGGEAAYKYYTVKIELVGEDMTNVKIGYSETETGTIPWETDRFAPLVLKIAPKAAFNRGTNDAVGGFDFEKAEIVVTKTDGTTVVVPGSATGFDMLTSDIDKVEFGAGLVIRDAKGNDVPYAIKNFKYDATKRWPAELKQAEDGSHTVVASKPEGAKYVSFVYHDWSVDHTGGKQAYLTSADGNFTLYGWTTKTPGLKQGPTNVVNDELMPGKVQDPQVGGSMGLNYDKSYGMVATPPADAPGADYWYMVMTDRDIPFLNATVTVEPDDAKVQRGAIPVSMVITELPGVPGNPASTYGHVLKHYLNSQFRIYRLGTEVNWRFDKATEYVSNTGLFYVDGLKKNTQTGVTGIGYKFSTHNPSHDSDWTEFDKHCFGYGEWSSKEATPIGTETAGHLVAWPDGEKKPGNIAPTVDGTLVIDLRTKGNIEGTNAKNPTKPGYMYMHEGFYRHTPDNKMLFYGSAIVPEGSQQIELTKIGLWNIDGCQVVNYGSAPDYNKVEFWQLITGFTVDAVKVEGEGQAQTKTPVDLNGADVEGNTLTYSHAMEDGAVSRSSFNHDYEFIYEQVAGVKTNTYKLPELPAGTYELTVRLTAKNSAATDAVLNTNMDAVCHPLVLTATIAPVQETALVNNVSVNKVALSDGEYLAALGTHKGNKDRFPVKYSAVNEVSVEVKPAKYDSAKNYTFKIDGKDVTPVSCQDGWYRISGLPFDGASMKTVAATVTVTVDGASSDVTVPATAPTANFASMFSSVDFSSSQVIITEGRLNGVKQYVYSANPVFTVNKPAGTSDLYKVGGFELDKSTLYNVTVNKSEKLYEMASQFDDWSFYYTDDKGKHIYCEPRVCGEQGVIHGQSDYTAYDHNTWDNAKNNWAELIIPETSKSVGMMIPHYYADPVKMTGTSTPQHGNYSVTFYTYYPVRDAAGNLSLVEVKGAKVDVNKDQTGSGVTGVENVTIDADALLDVYTLSGVRVMHNVSREEALQQLQPGVYLIGREKVAVQ